jgi:hypothetical protein
MMLLGFTVGMAVAPALAQQGAARGAGRGGRGGAGLIQSTDPRVQNRTYHFADTDEDLPYCLFVSSKVSKDKKNPLIVSLHGLGIGPGFMCRGKALDLAEEGGYILVAPMGYNTGGWYGSPVMNLGAGGARGARGPAGGAQGAAPAAPQGDADTAVPVTNTRMWVDTMKELKMNYEYKEIPGADHGSVIEQGMPDIFAFFNSHTKSNR